MSEMRQLLKTELAGIVDAFGSGPQFCMSRIAESQMGAEQSRATGLFLLPYLYRRFGPPFSGGDDVKDIACYWLTTRKEGLYLRVACKATGLRWCFGVGFANSLYDLIPWASREEPASAIVADCHTVLNEALQELARPVYVRDAAFNIFGRVDDDCEVSVAERSEYAGYGIPRDAMDAMVEADK